MGFLRRECIGVTREQRSSEGHWRIWTNNELTWWFGPMKDREAARHLYVPSTSCVRLTTHARRTDVVSLEAECRSHSLKMRGLEGH